MYHIYSLYWASIQSSIQPSIIPNMELELGLHYSSLSWPLFFSAAILHTTLLSLPSSRSNHCCTVSNQYRTSTHLQSTLPREATVAGSRRCSGGRLRRSLSLALADAAREAASGDLRRWVWPQLGRSLWASLGLEAASGGHLAYWCDWLWAFACTSFFISPVVAAAICITVEYNRGSFPSLLFSNWSLIFSSDLLFFWELIQSCHNLLLWLFLSS
jgi:hypothetical protein